MLATDIVRMLVGLSVLAFAGLADLRWRRAPDVCWLVVAGAGAVLLAVDWTTTPEFWRIHQAAIWTAGIVFVLALVGYLTGLIAGGADAKALASLAILAPLPLGAVWAVPIPSPLPLAVTALTNGLIVALAVPFVLLAWNIAHGHLDGVRSFLGFRLPLEQVDQRVTWPLEYVDEHDERVVAASPRGVPRDAFDRSRLREVGVDEIWVTPKIPFLVPLWFGFALAVVIGDPFAALLRALLI